MTITGYPNFPEEVDKQLIRFLNNTNLPVFLTGKAGTGKTTLVKSLREFIHKNYIITASTGIAAVNAGGVTLHSLFQIPGGVYIPVLYEGNNKNIYSIPAIVSQKRYDKAKSDLLNSLELLIIDEVSMVRADLMDVIDQLLRKARGNTEVPFGGVQILMIGDLYQLPPVLTSADEPFYNPYYKTPYFFSSRVINHHRPVYLELKHIYRQKSDAFVNILNNTRHGSLTDKDIKLLNERVLDSYNIDDAQNLTLTSHVVLADEINQRRLAELQSPLVSYKAVVTGLIDEDDMSAEKSLELKVGSRIIFTKNDSRPEKQYYNGKTGVIIELDDDNILVQCDNSKPFAVGRDTWTNINYQLTAGNITKQAVGELAQFPVKLAWAITIHKSQGLTLDQATIDVGESFMPGQVYVAFSRLKSLEGLSLKSPVQPNRIFPHPALAPFESSFKTQDIINVYRNGIAQFIAKLICKAFDWLELTEIFSRHRRLLDHCAVANKYDQIIIAENWLAGIAEKKVQANRFQAEIIKTDKNSDSGFDLLLARVKAATKYFNEKLIDEAILKIIQLKNDEANKSQKEFLKSLDGLLKTLTDQQGHFNLIIALLTEINSKGDLETSIRQYFQKLRPVEITADQSISETKNTSASLSKTLSTTLMHFKNSLPVGEIAEKKKSTVSAIERQLGELVSLGQIQIQDIFPEELCSKLMALGGDVRDVSQLRIISKGLYSFFELRIYISYLSWIDKS